MKPLILAAALLPLAALLMSREASASTAPAAMDGDPLAVLPEPTFLETIGILDMGMTRGERNNNPGNIRQSASNWKGKVDGQDAAFETFESAVYGIRALAVLLRNYWRRGLVSVRQIVGTYAPASENNTESYIRAVAAALQVSPDVPLDLSNPDRLAQLVEAIIRHENGRVIYAASDIKSAVEMA